jgi:flagellar motility protein MotE (MotC chaperone)
VLEAPAASQPSPAPVPKERQKARRAAAERRQELEGKKQRLDAELAGLKQQYTTLEATYTQVGCA